MKKAQSKKTDDKKIILTYLPVPNIDKLLNTKNPLFCIRWVPGDLLVSIYGPDVPSEQQILEAKSLFSLQPNRNLYIKHTGPCHKWPGIIKNVHEERWLFDQYRYFWFLDEDVEIINPFDSAGLGRFFYELLGDESVLKSKKLEILQPVLQAKNFSHPHLLYDAFSKKSLIPVRFCEIMCPIIRNDVFDAMDFLHESESGWGLDHLWGVRFKNFKINTLIARHTRPVNSTNWVLSNGKTPGEELAYIAKKYGIA